jgi:hypothetical protein
MLLTPEKKFIFYYNLKPLFKKSSQRMGAGDGCFLSLGEQYPTKKFGGQKENWPLCPSYAKI